MAPALTSNSFRLAARPKKQQQHQLHRSSTIVCRFGFGGKAKDDAQGASESPGKSDGRSPFFFDLGKLPDATKSLIPVVSSPSTSLLARRRKDSQTVFVAGATGQAGVRIAQTLLRQGFTVRAGVPDLASAQELARIASTYKVISPAESKRLNAVESAFEEPEAIAKSIGPATKVVVTIGSAEKGPVTEVTTDEALRVVQAAGLAGVGHVVVVYDASNSIPGQSTYNVLDGITSFFSNLFSRTQQLTLSEFLAKVAETDVTYTLVKAALTEDYSPESAHGLVVAKERSSTVTTVDSTKVAKSQIATLVADIFANTSVSENKVVEVSTSSSAATKPNISELFSAIPEDGRRQAYKEAVAKAKAVEEAVKASQKASEAEEASQKLEEEVQKLSEEKAKAASFAQQARDSAEAAGTSLENILNRAKGIRGDFSWEKLSSQLAGATDAIPNIQIATVRGQAKARKLAPQKAVVKQQPKLKPKPQAQPKQADAKADVKKVFGFFKQETIYVDDD